MEHEHHPVGKASFEVVRQVLIDIRESTGFLGWKDTRGCDTDEYIKTGWDKLETYKTLEELAYHPEPGGFVGVVGVEIQSLPDEGAASNTPLTETWILNLAHHNLTGMLPRSLAKLDTLRALVLCDNNLEGFLPAHMGSVSCLPSLKALDVQNNKQLGGVLDANFLANCSGCFASNCHRSMQLPFLSGASLSSFNIERIFTSAPKAVVSEGRGQGKVAFLYPKGSPQHIGTEEEQDQMDGQYRKHTDHLQGLWQEQGAKGSYEEWLSKGINKWCCWQETWLSELRQLHKGYLFVFITPEKYIDEDPTPGSGELLTFTNKQSFETKFKSKMYTEGKVDDREWSSSKGSFMSGRVWCKEQCFDPSLGLADEGWGFEEGEEALGILDWERRHLASVSKKHGLQTVFITTACIDSVHEDPEIMIQVTRPSWFPYEGLKAPLGTFVHICHDSEVYRMVLAEEADEEGIAWDKECQERHEGLVQLLSEREQERMWAEDDLETDAASMPEEEVEELREECATFLQWIVENKLEEFWLDEDQHVMRGKIEGGSAAELLVLYRTVLRLGRKWQDAKGGGEEGVATCLLTLRMIAENHHEQLAREAVNE
jgi:hypothetical protein